MDRDVVICEPVRTAVGRFGGMFRDVPASDLGTAVVRALLERTGLRGESVDEVVLGHCYPVMDAPAIGRVVALDAGLPVTATGIQIDRRCGSGLQAVIDAALQVQTGASDVVIAGGAESMSRAPLYSVDARWGARGQEGLAFRDALSAGRVTAGGRRYPVPGGMIETAENLRRDFGISRSEQDEYALMSHLRADEASRSGRFDDEIVAVPGGTGAADGGQTPRDEQIRGSSTLERLSALRPIMIGEDPLATVTAGNSSGQNDGAAACVVTTPERAEELGLRPIVRLVSWGLAGVAPDRMGLGPVPAVAKALDRAGVPMSSIDLIELNEAFAAQVIACMRAWSMSPADLDRVNVNGSGISLGHPLGATGGRILATLSREMERRGARFGLETMCIGGGQGIAALFELVA